MVIVKEKNLEKLVAGQGQQCSIYYIRSLETEGRWRKKDAKESLEQALQNFRNFFSGEPDGLPPARGMDHDIPLEAGSSLVNLRPY